MQRPLIDGRYILGDLLGSGGMAKVYLAHDEVLGRDIALKVLREQYADDEEFVERFRREAKNAASLNHPNIVQIYDQGRSEDGTYYMATEYVPGGTLKERISKEGPLDPGEAAGIASRVAEALVVAHGRGIVHRDIKPQNVLLTTSGEAKVADLGIAKAATATTMTQAGSVMGSPAYLSPEQARGTPVGPASDLYSLGVVLYEMLTGELPFDAADNPLATAMKHLDEQPRRPQEVNPAVPEALDALTAKLLAKKPEDRYAGAAELAKDLRRVRGGLLPLATGLGEQRTAQMSQNIRKTRAASTAVTPGSGRVAGYLTRRRVVLPAAVLLSGVVLLGALGWALSRGPSGQVTPVSDGAKRVEVPAVLGLTRDEAKKRLDATGLRLGFQYKDSSDEVAAGTVVEQDPEARTEAERGTAVDVTVSTGPAEEPATQSSPSAAPTASPSASPASGEKVEKATKKVQKAREKAAEERKKALEEARKKAEKKQEERQKALEEARKEAQED